MSIKKFRKELTKALDKNPSSMVFVRLADTFRVEDKLEKAEEILLEGLNKHPGFFTANLAYAKVLLQMGRIEEAKDLFEEVVRVDSRCISALNHLVQISMELGNAEKAEQYNTQVSDLDPYHSLDDGLSMFDLDDESTVPMEGGELVEESTGESVSPDAIAEGVDDIFGSDEERNSEFAKAATGEDVADIGLEEPESSENAESGAEATDSEENEGNNKADSEESEVSEIVDNTPIKLDTSDQDELLEEPSPEEIHKEQLELKSIDSALENQGLSTEELSLEEKDEDPDFLKEMNQFKEVIVSGGIEMAGSLPDEEDSTSEENASTKDTVVDEQNDISRTESSEVTEDDLAQLDGLESVLDTSKGESTEQVDENTISNEDMLDLDDVSEIVEETDAVVEESIAEAPTAESVETLEEPIEVDDAETIDLAALSAESEDELVTVDSEISDEETIDEPVVDGIVPEVAEETETVVEDSTAESVTPDTAVESVEALDEPIEVDEVETIDLAALSAESEDELVTSDSEISDEETIEEPVVDGIVPEVIEVIEEIETVVEDSPVESVTPDTSVEALDEPIEVDEVETIDLASLSAESEDELVTVDSEISDEEILEEAVVDGIVPEVIEEIETVVEDSPVESVTLDTSVEALDEPIEVDEVETIDLAALSAESEDELVTSDSEISDEETIEEAVVDGIVPEVIEEIETVVEDSPVESVTPDAASESVEALDEPIEVDEVETIDLASLGAELEDESVTSDSDISDEETLEEAVVDGIVPEVAEATETVVEDSTAESVTPDTAVESVEALDEPIEVDEVETIDLAALSAESEDELVTVDSEISDEETLEEAVVDGIVPEVAEATETTETVVEDSTAESDSADTSVEPVEALDELIEVDETETVDLTSLSEEPLDEGIIEKVIVTDDTLMDSVENIDQPIELDEVETVDMASLNQDASENVIYDEPDELVLESLQENSTESLEELEIEGSLDVVDEKPNKVDETESEDDTAVSSQFFNVLGDESLGGIDESLLETIDSVEVDEDLGLLIEEQEHENGDTTNDTEESVVAEEQSDDVSIEKPEIIESDEGEISSTEFFNVQGAASENEVIDPDTLDTIEHVEIDGDLNDIIEEADLDQEETSVEPIDPIDHDDEDLNDGEENTQSTFYTVTGDSSSDSALDLEILDGIDSVEVTEDLNEIVEENDLDDTASNMEGVPVRSEEKPPEFDEIESVSNENNDDNTSAIADEVLDVDATEMIDLAALSESINDERELHIDEETASIIDTSVDMSELADDDTSALDELRIQEVEEEQKQQKAAEVPYAIEDTDYFTSIDPSDLPTPTVTLAEIYFDQNLYAQALEMYRQLAKSDPTNEVIALRKKEIKEILTKKAED